MILPVLATEITINLSDAFITILYILGIVALGFIIYAFYHLSRVLIKLGRILDRNQKALTETLVNTSIISANVVDLTDELVEFAEPALTDMNRALAATVDGVDSISEVISSFGEVLNNLLGFARRATGSADMLSRVLGTVRTAAVVKSVVQDKVQSHRRKKKKR